MKRIITHFLGDVSFNARDLREIADTLDHDTDQELDDTADSREPTLAHGYSLDPLSTSTMRRLPRLQIYCRSLTRIDRLFRGAFSLELFQNARTSPSYFG
jgi:hypothetical protein